MGQSQTTRVLVIGLTGVGKTHFLDLLQYNGDTTKTPTNGYYECTYKGIHFIEYGGQMNWIPLLHDGFNCIYMFIRNDYTIERQLEAKSALLMICRVLTNIPLAILFMGTKYENEERIKNRLQLQYIRQERIVATISLEKNWKEGLSRLFEWTRFTK